MILLSSILFVLLLLAEAKQRRETFSLFASDPHLISKKDAWLQALLARDLPAARRRRRQVSTRQQQQQPQRPCPNMCNCNYETISCNDLIDTCDECSHWNQIDFNQIVSLRPRAFEHFKFSSGTVTHMIIYKLLNSTIGHDTFRGMRVPANAQVEITFQYNSLVQFERHVMRGVVLASNATLVFNFPYTTQVLFMAKSFDGMRALDTSSRLILRIYKSFSVRFIGESMALGASLTYFRAEETTPPHPTTTSAPKRAEEDETAAKTWSIQRGQVIFDVKSTHLIKFEESSFTSLQLSSRAKLIFDLELIEKLMFQRSSFANMNFESESRAIIYAKQVTFIDFKAYSFASLALNSGAKFQFYLEELASSLCLQRNVFSLMRLRDAHSHFNLSVVNSKNVMFMHNAFSHIRIEHAQARLAIGVFNMPSALLLVSRASTADNSHYRQFLAERASYIWPHKQQVPSPQQPFFSSSSYDINPGFSTLSDMSGGSPAAPMDSNTNLFFDAALSNNVYGARVVNPAVYASSSAAALDLPAFFARFKQAYTYNVSFEKNVFFNMTYASAASSSQAQYQLVLLADNMYTLLVDNRVLNYTREQQVANANVHFVLNVRHFVLASHALDYFERVRVEFVRAPRVFKFGLAPRRHARQPRVIQLAGQQPLEFLHENEPQQSTGGSSNAVSKTYIKGSSPWFLENSYENNGGGGAGGGSDDDYAGDHMIAYDNEDTDDEKKFQQMLNRRAYLSASTYVDSVCHIGTLVSKNDAIVVFEKNDQEAKKKPYCSCQALFLVMNQVSSLDELLSGKGLPCKPRDYEMTLFCHKQLELRCRNATAAVNEDNDDELFLGGGKDYLKFWKYCITEAEPLLESTSNTASYLYNSFSDIDAILASSSSSSGGSSSFSSSLFDTLGGGGGASDSSFKDLGVGASNSNGSSSSASSNGGGLVGSVAKVVGIVIACFICSVLVFMIAVNVIQYKYRNDDLLDDLECSRPPYYRRRSANDVAEDYYYGDGGGGGGGGGGSVGDCGRYNHRRSRSAGGKGPISTTTSTTCNTVEEEDEEQEAAAQQEEPWSWKRTFSVSSMKRTFSASSLRRTAALAAASRRNKRRNERRQRAQEASSSATPEVAVIGPNAEQEQYYDDDDDDDEEYEDDEERMEYESSHNNSNPDYCYDDEEEEVARAGYYEDEEEYERGAPDYDDDYNTIVMRQRSKKEDDGQGNKAKKTSNNKKMSQQKQQESSCSTTAEELTTSSASSSSAVAAAATASSSSTSSHSGDDETTANDSGKLSSTSSTEDATTTAAMKSEASSTQVKKKSSIITSSSNNNNNSNSNNAKSSNKKATNRRYEDDIGYCSHD